MIVHAVVENNKVVGLLSADVHELPTGQQLIALTEAQAKNRLNSHNWRVQDGKIIEPPPGPQPGNADEQQ